MKPRGTTLVYVAFLLSGFSALAYEVLAGRMLRNVLGSGNAATASVLVAFMVGLALGSLLGSRLAPRLRRPAYLFAIAEVGIGIWFLALPHLARVTIPLLQAAASTGAEPSLTGMRLVLAILLLLPPCLAMGLTLPALTQHLVRTTPDPARGCGFLYAWNNTGAAVGAFAAGVVLIPLCGVAHTTQLAVGTGWAAALLALAVGGAPDRAMAPRSRAAERCASPPPWTLLGCALLAGFAALVYEVAWTRALAIVMGSSVYAFALMLTAFIAGLGLGGMAAAMAAARVARPRLVVAYLQVGIALTALVLLPAFARLPDLMVAAIGARPRDGLALLLGQSWMPLLMMTTPACLIGATFPFLVQAGLATPRHPASWAGLLNGVGTLGSVAGALFGGFLLLPACGVIGTTATAAALNLAAAATLLAAAPRRGMMRHAWPLLAGCIAIAITLTVHHTDPARLAMSPIVRAARLQTQLAGSAAEASSRLDTGTLLYHRDGKAGTVSVRAMPGGERVIFVNGKPDASSVADLPTQVAIAQIPLLLHPAPTNIFVVGLASGVTAGSAATHPGAHVTCAELSPEMVAAAAFFADVNGDILSNPRLRLIVDDARAVLLAHPEQYDVIISEPSNPWLAGIADLFTREFFTLCRTRLKPDGLMCTWVETYALDRETVAAIVASFLEVFPHVTVWSVLQSDYLLIGSSNPHLVGPDALDARFAAAPGARTDLQRIGIKTPVELLAGYVCGTNGCRELACNAVVNTDDNAFLEYRAPRAFLADRDPWDTLTWIEAQRNGRIPLTTRGTNDAEKVAAIDSRIQARGLAIAASIAWARGAHESTWRSLADAATRAGDDPLVTRFAASMLAQAATALQAGNPRLATEAYTHLSTVPSCRADALYGLGYVARLRKDNNGAAAWFRRAVDAAPARLDCQLALAEAEFLAGHVDAAIAAYQTAAGLAPPTPALLNNLAWAQANRTPPSVASFEDALNTAEAAHTADRGQSPHIRQTLLRIARGLTALQPGNPHATRIIAETQPVGP